jgi:amidase
LLTHFQAKSAKDLVALMDALMLPTSRETGTKVPNTCFRIKEDWGKLRIGFTEPTIWTQWRKSGRINADAEKFMLQKYDVMIQSLIGMDVDVVYPVELPSQSSLNLDGKNCFEAVVCKLIYDSGKALNANYLSLDSEFRECLSEFIRQFKITKVHSLAEIINFNLEHPELTLPPCTPSPTIHLLRAKLA